MATYKKERNFLLNFFIFLIFFLLKDNCFTEFCGFLSYINKNQSSVYPSALPPKPPSHLPSHLTLQPVTEPLFEFPESYSKFPLAIYFTYGIVNFHVTLSKHLHFSSPPMSIGLFSMTLSP